jgi:uncharacterized protein (TIGR00297 family)
VRYRLGLGIGLSSSISALAYRRKALTHSGVVGAIMIGTIIFAFGGLGWGLMLIFFFVSSTLLSHLYSDRKQQIAMDKFSKLGARDWQQTVANGGIAALIALIGGLQRCQRQWLPGAFVGALATATADTWATEIGTLSRSQPRLITSGQRVPPGTSGGVTLTGTVAAAAGGLALGAIAMLASRWGTTPEQQTGDQHRLLAIGLGAGLAGTLCDSLLGATVQHIAHCPLCASETERAMHHCGTATVSLRGLRWMDNDAVNLLSTATGALIGAGLEWIIQRNHR